MKNIPFVTDEEIRASLRAQIIPPLTATKLAARLGFSPPYISDVLAGRRDISAALAGKLGYVAERVYFPVNVAPDPTPPQPDENGQDGVE